MPAPTAPLQDRLARLGLTESMLRTAARRHLARIARDLPPTDSALVDACLRAGHLTHWQAETLCGPTPDDLFIGPIVLEAERQRDHRTTTYEARIEASARCELIVLDGLHHPDRVLEALQPSLAARSPHPAVASVREGRVVDRSLVLVAPATGGVTLRKHLTRRGRLEAAAVASVAAELMAGLTALHRIGQAHGEVRLDRIRLTDRGVVLTQPGVRSAVEPYVAYRSGLPLADAVGIAPERIGTRQPADAASDRFALGCALWELLAGRSPFPQAGPLERLRAQAGHAPPPLADFVDAPAELVTLIESLLARDPTARPGSLPKLRVRPVRRRPSRATRPCRRGAGRIALTTAAMLAVTAGWIGLGHRVGDWAGALRPDATQASEQNADASGRMPLESRRSLPSPSADGVLTLTAGRYDASEIAWGGPLTITGDNAERPTIVVGSEGWNLIAESLTLSGVRVVADASSSQPLVRVQSQSLSLDRCKIDAARSPVAVAWTPLDAGDAAGRTVMVRDSNLSATQATIALTQPARSVELSNTVLTAGRTALLWSHPWPARDTAIELTHCTVRQADAVLAVDGEPTRRGQRLRILLRACVFDPSTRAATVVAIGDVQQLADARRRVAIDTAGCVTSARWAAVGCVGVPPQAADWLAVPQGELTFLGDELDEATAPLAADEWPGVVR